MRGNPASFKSREKWYSRKRRKENCQPACPSPTQPPLEYSPLAVRTLRVQSLQPTERTRTPPAPAARNVDTVEHPIQKTWCLWRIAPISEAETSAQYLAS